MILTLKETLKSLSRKEKIITLAALVGVVVSGTALLGIYIQSSTTVVPTRGGEYVEGLVSQPTYLNPVIAVNETDKSMVRLLFSNLNDLADKIEADPESANRIWRVRLKEGLVWHDNHKITSDDVIFTIQKIQDPETQSPLSPNWRGVTPNRVSELEFQLTLAVPYAFFPDNLKNLYIIPKHLFVSIPSANWRLSDYSLKPVGSGPYVFNSFEKQEDGFIANYRLKTNDLYFNEKPLIPSFEFRFFSNLQEAMQSFNDGEIDGIGFVGSDYLENIDRPYSLYSFHLPSYYAVFMNQSKSLSLKEYEVREAMSKSIDKKALIESILKGHAAETNGPIPKGAAYAHSSFESSSSTIDEIKTLLEENGWEEGEDGVRFQEIGKSELRLEFVLTVPDIPFLVNTARFLEQSWKEIGVKINLDIKSSEEISNNAIKNRDYEMLLFGNVLGPSSELLAFWHSSERFSPGFNLSLFNDEDADELMELIHENTDPISRTEQFQELQELIVEAYPAVFLYSPDFLYVANKNLAGVESGAIAEPNDRFKNVASWYLNTARVFK